MHRDIVCRIKICKWIRAPLLLIARSGEEATDQAITIPVVKREQIQVNHPRQTNANECEQDDEQEEKPPARVMNSAHVCNVARDLFVSHLDPTAFLEPVMDRSRECHIKIVSIEPSDFG